MVGGMSYRKPALYQHVIGTKQICAKLITVLTVDVRWVPSSGTASTEEALCVTYKS